MGVVTPGFTGRARSGDPRLPPGQYLAPDFPVLSAGPTPRVRTDDWEFTVVTESGVLCKTGRECRKPSARAKKSPRSSVRWQVSGRMPHHRRWAMRPGPVQEGAGLVSSSRRVASSARRSAAPSLPRMRAMWCSTVLPEMKSLLPACL